jgi:hypothetical protein
MGSGRGVLRWGAKVLHPISKDPLPCWGVISEHAGGGKPTWSRTSSRRRFTCSSCMRAPWLALQCSNHTARSGAGAVPQLQLLPLLPLPPPLRPPSAAAAAAGGSGLQAAAVCNGLLLGLCTYTSSLASSTGAVAGRPAAKFSRSQASNGMVLLRSNQRGLWIVRYAA